MIGDRYPEMPPTPSGKPADGYGEIILKVWLRRDGKGEVQIESGLRLPFPFWMLGCEHLIRATAQLSNAGYEKAIDLLVEGALDKNTRGKIIDR